MRFNANQQMRLPALKIISAIDSVKIVRLFSASVSENFFLFYMFKAQRLFFFSNVALFTPALSYIMFGHSGLLQPDPPPVCSLLNSTVRQLQMWQRQPSFHRSPSLTSRRPSVLSRRTAWDDCCCGLRRRRKRMRKKRRLSVRRHKQFLRSSKLRVEEECCGCVFVPYPPPVLPDPNATRRCQ